VRARLQIDIEPLGKKQIPAFQKFNLRKTPGRKTPGSALQRMEHSMVMSNRGRYVVGDPDIENFIVTHRNLLDKFKAEAYAETSRALAESGVPPADWSREFLLDQGSSCQKKVRSKVDAEWNPDLDVKYKEVCSWAITGGAFECLEKEGDVFHR
jgi:hypothetical protein